MNILNTLDIYRLYPRKTIKFASSHFHNNNLIGAEIGVDKGINACSILKTLKIKKLYLVDPYFDYDDEDKHLDQDKRKTIARKKLENHGQRVQFIYKTFEQAVNDKDIIELDFVYIDANHSYDFVMNDIKNALRVTKVGGIIGGHNNDRDGVLKAVVQSFKNQKIYSYRNDWWVIRQ